MKTTRWNRLARAYALLLCLMVVIFSVLLIIAPEKTIPGSSSEPARTLALMFASRTILLGMALGVLAFRRGPQPLAWVLFADATLQAFATAMAFATHKGALTIVPAALGLIDIWAGLWLLRASQPAPTSRVGESLDRQP